MLLDEIESMLGEAGLTHLREEGMLVLMIGEEGKDVVIYIVAEEKRGVAYVLATAYPPLKAEGRELDLMRASWDLVDKGIPCKVAVDRGSAVVEMDLDRCHLKKDYLLESIYYVAESMLTLLERMTHVGEGSSDTEG
ncbi:MAG: hypothetical protein QI199_01725 [Candidatus Korarchaeota archaeon]|nr:hypothetical protein [Candidatus Korarchaeota archaeon]